MFKQVTNIILWQNNYKVTMNEATFMPSIGSSFVKIWFREKLQTVSLFIC
jgi:hypothetical protein